MINDIPENWRDALDYYVGRDGWRTNINNLGIFLHSECRAGHRYHPTGQAIFNAFYATPFDKVRVVIIGQDPYLDKDEATGIAFFADGKSTPSLTNIYEAMRIDNMEGANLTNACLKRWAEEEYVLLLNSVLTFRKCNRCDTNTHMHMGWKCFIEAVVKTLAGSRRPIHFMLWGNEAKRFAPYTAAPICRLHETYHPTSRGNELETFKKCRHFSAVNKEINAWDNKNYEPIKWLPQENPNQ